MTAPDESTEQTGEASALSVPSRIQRGLETLYRLEQVGDVEEFLIDEAERARASVTRAPREQLLLRQAGDEVAIGLFLAPDALANLHRHDPADGLHAENFDDFCLVVEGVSHFLYVVRSASADRTVSALELELQAEVDKFACCVLLEPLPGRGRLHCQRLFEDIRYAEDLDADERDRYRAANDNAHRYARSLVTRYVEPGRLERMLTELRAFYRLDLDGKRAHIDRVAA